jgi:predicted metal-binding membrane protein
MNLPGFRFPARPAADRETSTGTVLARAREHRAVVIGTAALAAMAWAVTAWTSLDMSSAYAQLAMPMGAQWSAANALAAFAMWSVMMAAMMLPSALPVILIFAGIARKGGAGSRARLWLFTAGYLAVWFGFSAGATVLQWGLLASGLLEPMQLKSIAPYSTAGLLLLAGIVQFSRLKQTCLATCRSPLGFLMQEWREGFDGAWIMGLRHGVFCLGCCWALMLLLFAFGAMNLVWVGLLALIVAIEKMAPHGALIARSLGLAMIAAGALHLTLSLQSQSF